MLRGTYMQPRKLFIGILILTLAVPAFALAHPPAVDPHNSCVVRGHDGVFTVPTQSVSTLSYLWPMAGPEPTLKCQQYPPQFGPYTSEWGSHAAGCPPPPFVGVVAGVFCGPVVPPGGTGTCSWIPVQNTVPTGLIIGFDGFRAQGAPGFDGFVNLVTSGEIPVFGPFPSSTSTVPPKGWTAPNPYGVPARVMGFPTNIAFTGVLAPADSSLVICVTP